MVAAFLGFLALGTWQVKRLFWKLELIERVDRRVHASPVDTPAPAAWPSLVPDDYEYRHVRLNGIFEYGKTARVQALTRLGGGVWLLTPLRGADGTVTLINRGFIVATARDVMADAADAPVEITGLMRVSEPRGGFLRHNDAAADRWFSRDVEAIATARGLHGVAPYFVDADAASVTDKVAAVETEQQRASKGMPVGGLTVIAFHNSHLVYAFTWYALACMTAGAGYWVMRDEQRRRAACQDQENHDAEQR